MSCARIAALLFGAVRVDTYGVAARCCLHACMPAGRCRWRRRAQGRRCWAGDGTRTCTAQRWVIKLPYPTLPYPTLPYCTVLHSCVCTTLRPGAVGARGDETGGEPRCWE